MSTRPLTYLVLPLLGGAVLGAAAYFLPWPVGVRAALTQRAAEAARRQGLDSEFGRGRRLDELKHQLADGLFEGRHTFTEAVELLAASETAKWPPLLGDLRRSYRLSAARDCWATNLLVYAAAAARRDPRRRRQWSAAWLDEYRTNFRVSSPPPWEWDGLRDSPPLAGVAGGAPAGARPANGQRSLVR